MVIVSISAQVKSVHKREMSSACRSITERTCRNKDCLSARIMLDAYDENVINIQQRWEHRSSMEDYFRSDLFSALIGAMQVLAKSWEIQIDESHRTEGLEYVEAMRGQGSK